MLSKRKFLPFIFALFPFLLLAEIENNPFSELRGNGMQFIENKGQIIDVEKHLRPDILFMGQGKGMNIFLRKCGISYVMHKSSGFVKEKKDNFSSVKQTTPDTSTLFTHRVDMNFVGGNPNAQIMTSEQTEGYFNYYYEHCPNGITNVHAFNRVVYKNIYKNIDVVFYGGKEHGLKYDIVVRPGGNPNDIKISYSGANNLVLDNEKLKVECSLGNMIESMPKVYQNINGKIIDVKAAYNLNGTTLNFELSNFETSFPLIIDPWLSYFGGTSDDHGTSVTNDPSGNVLFTGNTSSNNFPVLGAFQGAISGISDAFIAKMTSSGILSWATYYGGSGGENGQGISTDATGNILVCGTTYSANFPTGSAGANVVHQATAGGVGDGFLIKLDPLGARLFATRYGGFNGAIGSDVTSDGNNIYLYGQTSSSNAISTAGAFQANLLGNKDVFIVKFTSNGTRIWGTYVGGGPDNNEEVPAGIAYDPVSLCIYIAGYTQCTNFPTLLGHQMTHGGSYYDMFLCKFDASGAEVWGTYYGGLEIEYGTAIATDAAGNVYILGTTTSSNAIATAGAFQNTYGGPPPIVSMVGDGFLAKFSGGGVLKWGTYIGGSNSEFAWSVAVDRNNNAYVYGDIEDGGPANYPATSCAYQTNFGGGPSPSTSNEDQYIAKYDSSGNQRCLTYLGGTEEEESGGETTPYGAKAISIHRNNLYLTGMSRNGSYPVTSNAYQTAFSGGTSYMSDAFIDQLCINLCESQNLGLDFSSDTNNVCSNYPLQFIPSVNNSCDTIGYRFFWTFSGGTPATSSAAEPTVSFSSPGGHDVKLLLTTYCKKDSVIKTNYINIISPVVSLTGNNNICTGDSSVLSATGGGSYSWNTGATTSTITIQPTTSTPYSVTVTNTAGCSTDTLISVIVNLVPVADAGPNDTICRGENAVLNASGGAAYSWSNGSTNANLNLNPLLTTPYTVTVSNGNCSDVDSAKIVVNNNPTANAGTNATIAVGQSITLSGAGTGNYLWYPSAGLSCVTCAGPTASPTQTTKYYLLVTDVNGCTSLDSITVTIDIACDELFVPTAFSPNEDGQNDVFKIWGDCIKKMKITIYDRWGETVFTSDNIQQTWDGKYKGTEQNSAVFYYTFIATLKNNEEIIKKGNITLIK